MFELADLWCTGTELSEYTAFIKRLTEAVFEPTDGVFTPGWVDNKRLRFRREVDVSALDQDKIEDEEMPTLREIGIEGILFAKHCINVWRTKHHQKKAAEHEERNRKYLEDARLRAIEQIKSGGSEQAKQCNEANAGDKGEHQKAVDDYVKQHLFSMYTLVAK